MTNYFLDDGTVVTRDEYIELIRENMASTNDDAIFEEQSALLRELWADEEAEYRKDPVLTEGEHGLEYTFTLNTADLQHLLVCLICRNKEHGVTADYTEHLDRMEAIFGNLNGLCSEKNHNTLTVTVKA